MQTTRKHVMRTIDRTTASRLSRRATLLVAAALLVAPAAAGALDLGLSASPWSFARPLPLGGLPRENGIAPGLYGRASAILGLGRALELEGSATVELAPAPAGAAYLGAEAAFPLAGTREGNYFNLFASLGFLQRVELAGGPGHGGGYLSLRVSPLAIGNPSYGRRDRIFSIGALYELGTGAVSLTWSLFAFDFFWRD